MTIDLEKTSGQAIIHQITIASNSSQALRRPALQARMVSLTKSAMEAIGAEARDPRPALRRRVPDSLLSFRVQAAYIAVWRYYGWHLSVA